MIIGIYGTVYNSEDTVEETIKSLQNTLKDKFVIAVVDNYSTDKTYEKLQKYKFVYVLRKKCTRGKGRQIALEFLINNFDVDYIFYIDFDLTFPSFFGEVIERLKKIYRENEVYFPFGFASYNTYVKILSKIKWRDMNVMEDHLWSRDLVLNGFRVKQLCIPLAFNQIRKEREKKYATGIKYYIRKTKIYKDYLYYIFNNLILIKQAKMERWYLNRIEYILPEDIGMDKNLFLFSEKLLPRKLRKKLKGENIYVYKGKKFTYIFRDFSIMNFVKNKVLAVEGTFDENRIRKWIL